MTNSEYHELIEFLTRHFTAIDQRFTAIDERFTAIDQRFTAIDQRFVAIDQRLVAIDQRFAAVDHRFAAIDRRLDAMQEHFDERFREVLGHFDELYRRLERLEQEQLVITHGLRRIEALLADEQGRRELLERRVEELKRDLIAVQARLAELERRLHG